MQGSDVIPVRPIEKEKKKMPNQEEPPEPVTD